MVQQSRLLQTKEHFFFAFFILSRAISFCQVILQLIYSSQHVKHFRLSTDFSLTGKRNLEAQISCSFDGMNELV